MTASSTTSLQYVMKTYYTPEFIQDYIFNDNKVLDRIFGGRQPANSKNIYTPIRVRWASGSTQAITETGAEPTAAAPTDYYCQDNVKIVDTRKEVTQLVINLTKNSNYNYRAALDDMNMDAMGEHADFMNRALFNDAGYMATCSSAASANSVTFGTGTNMDQFYVGQAISILVKSNGATSAGTASDTIATINKSTRTITLAGSGVDTYGSIDSTYGCCALGSVSGTTNLLFHGLPTLINDSNGVSSLHGVTISSYPEFISYMKDGASGDLDLEDMQEVIDEIELRSKGKIDLILCHDKLLRKYQYTIIEPQTIRMPGDASYGTAGTGEVYFRGRSKVKIPIMCAAYCNPTDDMYFIDTSALKVYHGAFMEWLDDDGKYIRKVSGYYSYEASMSSEVQIIAAARKRLGRIYDIDIS